MTKNLKYTIQAGIIAAIYIAITFVLAPISYGPLQFRASEALMVLPALTPAAIPGLFIGCLIANFTNPNTLGIIDIVFGSLATLLAAITTYFLYQKVKHNKKLTYATLPLPSVIFNGLIVGSYLPFLLFNYNIDGPVTPIGILLCILSIAFCEAVVVYALGIPLFIGLKKTNIFKS